MPLIKAVHSINTTVSTLHGITPIEVILGRPVNEKSVLLAKRKEGAKQPSLTIDLDTKNEEDKIKRDQISKTIHSVILRGQKRQIR